LNDKQPNAQHVVGQQDTLQKKPAKLEFVHFVMKRD